MRILHGVVDIMDEQQRLCRRLPLQPGPHISLLCLTSERKKGRGEQPSAILTTQSGIPMIRGTLHRFPMCLSLPLLTAKELKSEAVG
jgi:hypothetical protein